jgi:hypothetical protein
MQAPIFQTNLLISAFEENSGLVSEENITRIGVRRDHLAALFNIVQCNLVKLLGTSAAR